MLMRIFVLLVTLLFGSQALVYPSSEFNLRPRHAFAPDTRDESSDRFGKTIERIPEYGDADFWYGSMGITGDDLLNLGLMSGSAWRREWIVENILKHFSNSPPEVIALLKKRIANPRRTHQEILQVHEVVKNFMDIVGSEDDKIKRIMLLIREFSTSKEAYYKELHILRNKHYRSKYWKTIFKHIEPYPETTSCLILLGRMIIILQEIDSLLPDTKFPYIQHWKRKIRETLNRKEIKPFLEQENFLGIVAEYSNPYIFAPLEYLSENPPARLAKKIEELDMLERRFDFDFSFNLNRRSTSRRDAILLIKHLKQDDRFEKAREEFSQLAKQFGDLWEINVPSTNKMKINRKPQDVHITEKQAFLRQFPDGKMQSLLPEIYYYSTIAKMILEDGYKLPNILQPTGTIKLSSYKNPLLEAQPARRETPFSALFALLGRLEGSDESSAVKIRPITINLGGDDSALLLSGPNMGGKTATARGIGLAVLLTQTGFPLPDDDPEIAVFRNIYTIFPRPEQLQAGYGYFGMLIKELTELIKKTGPGDLVILDEVPTGTDYNELVAIATVLIEDLINRGATVIVTGHLKRAFSLIAGRTGQQPYMHTVTEKDGKIIPDFGLAPGIAKHSHAIELMRQAGFPSEIVELARLYYGVITEKEDVSKIPTAISVRKASRDGMHREEAQQEVGDAELIKAVVSNLYHEDNFAFPKTQESIITTLISQNSGSAYPSEEEKLLDTESSAKSGIKAIDDALHYTEAFVNQGEPYLRGLTEILSVFNEISRRQFRFWGKYDLQENMGKLDKLEQASSRLTTHLEDIKGELEIEEMFNFFEELIKDDIPALRKKYLGKNYSALSGGDLEKMQTEWQSDWEGLLDTIISGLGFFDTYTGIARGVIEWNLKPPLFSKEPNTFSLKNSKPFFPNRSFWGGGMPFIQDAVVQSFEVNPDRPVMVLTGPNSSGKTVMMFNSRMNALFAMNGFYVSGDLEMSIFDNIYTFFGGMNEVTTGESYFLNIIGKYADIINQVTPNSLVILDELHGTDNFELAAIQVAVLHYLRSMNCTVIFNTHVRDGLKIADEKVGLDFWKTDVEYDASDNKVTPFYTLSPDPNLEAKSYGLAIASEWLSSDQIARANEILYQLEKGNTEILTGDSQFGADTLREALKGKKEVAKDI